MSERKAQAIYDAVHEVLMKVRVEYRLNPTVFSMHVEEVLYQAQIKAAAAAVRAYKKPLSRKKP